MSRPQNPLSPFLPFGNPYRMICPKSLHLSPKLLDLLNTFEEALAGRLKRLKPVDRKDILCLSWMRFSMELLCGIHTDIKSLIAALEHPVVDWDDKWIDMYLDDSVKLLDICNAFSSEISRLKQGHLFLRYVLHNLGSATSKEFVRLKSSLDEWRQIITSKNPRFDNCFSVMETLAQTLDLPQIKNSAKGKVLMRAIYGVKVATLFICSIFAAAFSGSTKKLMDIQVPKTYLWAEAFTDIQMFVNKEISNTDLKGSVSMVKELEAVETSVKKLHPILRDGVDEAELLRNSTSDLKKSAENLSQELDLLAKDVQSFFQIVLSGREALLCNLRIGGNVSK